MKLRNDGGLLIMASVLAVGLAQAAHANLVINPGFETGNGSNWTVTRAGSGSDLFFWSGYRGQSPHTGNYFAHFGATGNENDTITQTISTTPGSTYVFSFWLNNVLDPTASYFTASWNGNAVLNLTPSNDSSFNWTQFSFAVTATGSSTAIGFAGRNAPAAIFLDDVSVTVSAVPEPTTMVAGLGALGLVLMTIGARTRHPILVRIEK